MSAAVQEYPIPDFEHFRFHSTGIALSALDFGNAPAPDLIIVHGIRDLAWSVAPLVEALRADYHVIAPDLRGHGDSDRTDAFTMQHFVADLRALVVERGIASPIVVGHSLGGHIATQYTIAYPEDVRALVLIDGLGPPRAMHGGEAASHQAALRGSIESLLQMDYARRTMRDVDEARERLQRANPKLAPATAAFLAQVGTEPAPDGGVRWKWLPQANQVWSSMDNGASEERWRTIACPILLVTGDRSMEYWTRRNLSAADSKGLLNREIERRTALFQDARHVMIPDAGHMVHYDQPELLNRAIRSFVDGL